MPISRAPRDSIHTRYNKFRDGLYLIDTAGMKEGKVTEDLEYFSVIRSCAVRTPMSASPD